MPVRCAVVLADGALLSTGVCVCSPARCCCRAMYFVSICRFVAFFVFFRFSFVIVVECRLCLLFVATVLASLLTSTQILFDFVRRLIRLDDVFSFDLLVVSPATCVG